MARRRPGGGIRFEPYTTAVSPEDAANACQGRVVGALTLEVTILRAGCAETAQIVLKPCSCSPQHLMDDAGRGDPSRAQKTVESGIARGVVRLGDGAAWPWGARSVAKCDAVAARG